MLEILPQKLIQLAAACPFRLYVVGGACRDYITGVFPRRADWDICAPADVGAMKKAALSVGMQVRAEFPATGSLKLFFGEEEYEFTSFRTDIYGSSGHRPEYVRFTDDIYEDAKRRDFKCNAVYYDIGGGEFSDPLGGVEDIKCKKISAVSEPCKLFSEDALRIMRLARFCGELGFTADEQCICAAKKNSFRLADIPAEQLRREMDGILLADKKYGNARGHERALRVLCDTGALFCIFKGFPVVGGRQAEEIILSVGRAPEDLRLAALLQAYCAGGRKEEEYLFDEAAVKRACLSLGYSRRVAERAARVAATAAFDPVCDVPEGELRRFLVTHAELAADALRLKEARGGGGLSFDRWRKLLGRMKEEGVPFSRAELAVSAKDLIAAGVPREKTAAALDFLLLECALDGSFNAKNALLSAAAQRFGIK